MKKFKFSKVSIIVLAIAFTLGLGGIIAVRATVLPFTPDLGVATTFGVLSSTFSNASTTTTITGDLGYTTGPAFAPTLNGNLHTDTTDSPVGSVYADAGAAQADALSDLNTQDCTFIFSSGAVDLSSSTDHPSNIYTPGVYCTSGVASAMSVDSAPGIILSGSGTFVFRSDGALNVAAGPSNGVVLDALDPPSACDVFWTPNGATNIGADSTFIGTVIPILAADHDITILDGAEWIGRALTFGHTVTTPDFDVTITVPTCTLPHLTVVKEVIGGGPKVATDFKLFVDAVSVTTEIAKEVSAGSHTVTETIDSNYTQSFSASCPLGIISLSSGVNKTCTIYNTYIPPVSSGGGGGTVYGCKDEKATNYNFFSSSKPELCIYDKPTITIISTPVVIVPKLPKTGFPTQTWYESLLNSFLNLFR